MATFTTDDVYIIEHVKLGKWKQISCPAIAPPQILEQPIIGDYCDVNVYGTQVKFNDICYECEGGELVQEVYQLEDDANETVYAKCNVSFDENTGSSVNDIVAYYGRPYGTLPNTSKTGYSFNGWFTDETWANQITAQTICSLKTHHTLHAKLDLNYYTITFKNYAGVVVSTQNIAHGTMPTLPATTADTAQYDYYWPSTNVATQNITYTELRSVKSYVIIWKSYSGAILKTETLPYGSVSNAPSGTSDTAQYDYSWPKSSTTVSGTETITETRALRYYTVTWKDHDGTTLKTESVAYGGNGTPPTEPTRTGYVFSSWSGDYTGITGNVTITATYVLELYTLDISAITGVASQTVHRTSSPIAGASIQQLVDSAIIYYGDVLTIQATASTAYSVTVSGSPITVSGDVYTSNHITVSQAPVAPTITYVSRTDTSLTFTVKNNNPYSARVYYEIGDSTPDSDYVTLNAGATSGNLTINGLTTGTGYTVYSRSYSTVSSLYSTSVSFYKETVFYPSVPTITIIKETFFSVEFTIKNNSSRTCEMYEKLSSEANYSYYGTLAAGATSNVITKNMLTADTVYTAYAYSRYDGTNSNTALKTITTIPTQVKPTNNILYLGVNRVDFTITNNNPYEVEVHYGLSSSTSSGSVVVAANATSGQLSITGLSANSGNYLFSRTKKDGVYSTTDSDYFITLSAPVAPTITYVSKGINSITFTVKNNDNYPARIYYEHNDSSPDANYIDLAANTTSGNLTIGGLLANTSYGIYAQSEKDTVKSSYAVAGPYTTYASPIAPTITEVSKTNNSIVYTVKNNNPYSARVYYEIGDSTPDLGYVDLAAGATSGNISASSLSANTNYTVYARSYFDSTYSGNGALTITTYANPVAPTMTYVSKTHNSITFRVRNTNPYPVRIYYEHTDTTPDAAYVDVPANSADYQRIISGLTGSTTYTIYSRCLYNGTYSSNASITQTTNAPVQSLTPSSDSNIGGSQPYTTPNITVGISGDLYVYSDMMASGFMGYYEVEWYLNNVYQGYILVCDAPTEYYLGPTTIQVSSGDLIKFRFNNYNGMYSGFQIKADNASGVHLFTFTYEP